MDLSREFKSIRSCPDPENPQMEKALRILEMSSRELFEYVEEQLETNPVLELLDRDEFLENGKKTLHRHQREKANPSEEEQDSEADNDDDEMDDFIIHNYTMPDMIITKIKDKYEVFIYDEAIPDIGINAFYQGTAPEGMAFEAREFIQGKLASARCLIKNIDERCSILKSLAEYMISGQRSFFEKGRKYVKKLSLKKAAKSLCIHKTVLEKAIRRKYIQCSWGYFPLEYFFYGEHFAVDGKKEAWNRIKSLIENIIESEDKRHPPSDNRICSLLKEEGIDISRREVNKFRNEMGIAPSNKRKQTGSK